MNPANMDYTMAHSDHHHPHYQQHHHSHHHHHPHHTTGGSSSAAASRCPAIRASAGPRHLWFADPSSTRAEQYDPVHGHTNNRSMWQSRSPQNWQPAMIAPYGPVPPGMGALGTLPASTTTPNQPSHPSFPACPVPNVPDVHLQNQPFPRRADMLPALPAPRLHDPASFDRLVGFQGSNSSQSNTQNSPRPSVQAANTSLPSAASLLAGSPAQALPPTPTTTFRPTGQVTSFGNENSRPEQQPPPNTLPQILQSRPQPLSAQIPYLHAPQNTTAGRERSTASRPPSMPASTAPQRNNDHSVRITNPVDIRRAAVGAMGRARQRYTSSNFSNVPALPEWLLEQGNFVVRRDSPNSMEYVGNVSPVTTRGGPTKRVASKRALSSLQSVNIADLPESERTCVICYHDFGVANPEGVNEAPLRLPKCKHVFGDHCIKKWFQESDSCPYCRDKVHSELQTMSCRRIPGNRFPPHTHLAQVAAGEDFVDFLIDSEREHVRIRDRNVSLPASSGGLEEYMNSVAMDGMGHRPSSGSLRAESTARHPVRQPWGPIHDRRSPPISEHDRRRRPRQRPRNTQPSTNRGNASGSQSANTSLQSLVRASTLFPWSSAPPPNPLTGAPISNAFGAQFENLLQSQPDEFGLPGSPSSSGSHQLRLDTSTNSNFSSPDTSTETFDIHMGNSENVPPNLSAMSGHVAQPSLFAPYHQS